MMHLRVCKEGDGCDFFLQVYEFILISDMDVIGAGKQGNDASTCFL
jgi:hypothetical protein